MTLPVGSIALVLACVFVFLAHRVVAFGAKNAPTLIELKRATFGGEVERYHVTQRTQPKQHRKVLRWKRAS